MSIIRNKYLHYYTNKINHFRLVQGLNETSDSKRIFMNSKIKHFIRGTITKNVYRDMNRWHIFNEQDLIFTAKALIIVYIPSHPHFTLVYISHFIFS